MAAQRKDLFLQVSGDVAPLSAAMKVGKTVLLDLGQAANDVQAEVDRAFAKMGGGAPAEAKRVEKAYEDTFAAIRRNAKAVLAAPTDASALQILDVGAAQQAAAAAENQAQALRTVATAASAVAAREGEASQAARVLAVASATEANVAEQNARALRDQANALEEVARETGLASTAQAGATKAAGQTKAGFQQLGYQLNDVATQYASGASASIIFAQQSGQVIQALQMIAGEGKGLLGFLGGPWGVALTTAAVFFTPMIAKLFDLNSEIDKAEQKLREEAHQTQVNAAANAVWERSIDGVAAKTRQLTQDLRDQLRTQQQVEDRNLDAAVANQSDTQQKLQEADRAYRAAKARADRLAGTLPAPGDTSAIFERRQAAADLKEKKRQFEGAVAAAAAAPANVRAAQVPILVRRADDRSDAGKAAQDVYEATIGPLTQKFVNGRITLESFNAALDKAKATLKAAQDAAKPKNPPSLGDQLTTERGARVLASAQGFTGLSETRTADRARLTQLFGAASDQPVDPKMTAWCAAFVNAVLATNGLPGTGSLAANSFLNYGTKTNKPQAGDIVVLRTGASQEHVGFYAGERNGRVLVTGGNQSGGKVTTTSFARSAVEAFRRAPGAADAERDLAQQQRRSLENAQAYETLKGRAQDELLGATRAQAVGIEALAALDLAQIEADRQRADAAAQAGVDEGKWTQAEADRVKALNLLTASLREQTVAERARQQLADRALEIQRHDVDGQSQLLSLQLDLATTAKERRRIALKILENEHKLARATLDAAIAAEQDPDRKADLERQRDREDQVYDLKRQKTEQQNEDPLQAYKRRIGEATKDVDEAMKGVAADGLEQLEDGLVGVVTGTETVAGAFKKMANAIIADLARIAVRKLILKMVGGSIGGFAEGGLVLPSRGSPVPGLSLIHI